LHVREDGPVKWGILGAADIAARRFVPALLQAEGAELAVVGSRTHARAEELVAKAGQGRPAGSYQEVLEDPDVEAVYIPLPNGLHEEWVLAGLAAGKHVLCEKPLVTHVEPVARIARAAEAAGRVVMEAFMYRLHPQYAPETWAPLLEEIGPVRTASARMSFPLDLRERPGDVRSQAELEGGALWDVGCYCLDVLCWQLGEVVDVQAVGELREGVDWTGSAQLRHASGVLSRAWWSFDGPLSDRLTLVGANGNLELTNPFMPTGPRPGWLESGGRLRPLGFPEVDSFRLEIEHCGKVIRGEAGQAVPLDGTSRWIQTAEEIHRQLRTPRPR
jgi:xylose dehydrogenase (NAD/NADP)